ncbi:MAG: ligand-binding sensor domain-containing protein, partial [Verrucomicrobiota bacterium]
MSESHLRTSNIVALSARSLFTWVLLLVLAFATRTWAQDEFSNSQEYLVKTWGPDEGMPMASVTTLAQTSEGYLWVGTLSSGLLRFDGVQFTVFNEDNTPQFPTLVGVRRLMVDQVGRLWISTYSSTLITWDETGFELAMDKAGRPEQLLWSSRDKVVFLKDGSLLWGVRAADGWKWQETELPHGATEPDICADNAGRIWYLRSETEIWLWENGRKTSIGLPPGLEHQRIRVLTADTQRRIWAGTDQMLAQWQEDHFVSMNPAGDEPNLSVKRIVSAGSSLWVEANGRMRRLSNSHWVAESKAWNGELSQVGRLNFLQGDRTGGLWGSLPDLGLVHVESSGAMIHLTTADGLPSNAIRFALNDREGSTWTGYDRGGLVQIHRRLFRGIGRQQGLAALVNSVCVSPGGTPWFGTYSGDVFRYQDGQCTNLVLPSAAGAGSRVVAADAAGRIWIATMSGALMVYADGKLRLVLDQKTLVRTVRLLLPARDGRLWIATGDSLWTLKDEKLTKVYEGSRNYYLAALGEGADGTIWAGTFDGILLRFNGQGCEQVYPPDYAQLGRLWSLCAAPDGALWIGTSKGGVLRYHEGKFQRYTTQNGLPSDHIVQVLTDAPGNLWLGTGVGIVRVPEEALSRFDRGEISSVPFSIYGKFDGLLTIGCSIEFQPNCWRGPNGELWFAMVNSVASVQPTEVRGNPLPPGVGIEGVWSNGRLVWPTRRGAVFFTEGLPVGTPAVSQPAPLRLGPGRQDLEFVFTALSLDSPQGVRFRSQLAGIDSDWN